MKRIYLLFLLLPFLGRAQSGIINTIAGDSIRGFTGDGGLAIDAEFNDILCIAFDHSGNIYLSDVNNNVIRKINTLGIVTTVAGIGTASGYAGDGGQATAALLNGPTGFALDNSGNLYIAEASNDVIRKVNSLGIISTIAGNQGTIGYSGDGGLATAAILYYPYGIAIDNSDNLYFSDAGNHTVRKINTSGIITTIAGTGTAGYTGDGGPATDAKLSLPGYLAVSSSGEIYIPDYINHCVRKVNTFGIITTVAGNGTSGNSGDEELATAAQLNAPNTVNFDDSGNFYICDNYANVVRKVNTAGIITTVAGNDTMGFSGDGARPIHAEFNTPSCVIFNTAGNMFIADAYNNRIRKVTYHPEDVTNITKTQNNVSIYPNPALDKVTIKTTDKIESVEVLTLIGQTVYKQSFGKASNAEIAISNFANGVYFVKVNGVYAGKFVKQ